MFYLQRVFVFSLCFSLFVIGCSDGPDPVDGNNDTPVENNQPGEELNACGGEDSLLYDGAASAPGDECGLCGGGELQCDGTDALICVGATEVNICGGCEELDAKPGEECGQNGTWQCDEDGALTCEEASMPEVIIRTPEVAEMSPEEVEELFEVGPTSAVFRASFDELPEGIMISDHGFCWSNEPGPTMESEDAECKSLGAMTSAGDFSFSVSDLLPGHDYYVRAYAVATWVSALTENTAFYTEDIHFVTLAEEQKELRIDGSLHPDYVPLVWDEMDGAFVYILYRDGVEIARVLSRDNVFSYHDTDAQPGGVPLAPEGLIADGDYDRVTLQWEQSDPGHGTRHSYQIRTLYPSRETKLSEGVEGYRIAEPVTHYELSVDGGAWQHIGDETSYDDMQAPAPSISAPTISTTKGIYTTHVVLAVEEASVVSQPVPTSYKVRAVSAKGASEESEEVSGMRAHGALAYQWERSSGTTALDFSALSGATSSVFDDSGAPVRGFVRHYRLVASAQGAATVYSDAEPGFRAALAELSVLAPVNVEMNSASLRASLDFLGAPNPTAHGFCYSTMSNPDHSGGAICTQLGATSSTGIFWQDISGLEDGTRYFVRAYAVTNAGTAYSDEWAFWTRPTTPVVTASVRQNTITLEWEGVRGAAQYVVLRDGTEIAAVSAATLTYDDNGAERPPAPAAPFVISVTNGERSDGVLVEWRAASVSPGQLHEYNLIALNPDDLGSVPGVVSEQLRARSVTGYEIKVGDNDWIEVDTSGGLSYFDSTAPLGSFVFGTVNATDATTKAHVELTVGVDEVVTPAVREYMVRASNSMGSGAPMVTSGRRGVGDLHYKWRYSDSGAAGPFTDLFVNPDIAATTYHDTTANADGTPRHYYVEVSAEGAVSKDSVVVSGYKAVDPIVTAQAASDVEVDEAKLHGTIVYLGIPEPTEHGFCYGTMVAPDHTNGAICTTLGATSSQSTFSQTVSGLSAGTQYFVQAYATNNADTVYSGVQSFWTRPVAPVVEATNEHHDKVVVSWNSVTGAAKYIVYRDNDEIQQVIAPHVSHDDIDADAAPVPHAPTITATTAGERNDGVLIEWDAAQVEPGTLHDYKVIAVNADDLEGAAGLAQGRREARDVTGYEISIAGGNWEAVDTKAGRKYLDEEAPKSNLTLGAVSASDGLSKDHVVLSVSVASASVPDTQHYKIRALNGAGDGQEASTSGRRGVSDVYYYQWFHSASGDIGTFSESFAQPETDKDTYNDTNALADGTPHYFYVQITADGANDKDSDVVSGYKAVYAQVSTADASEVEKYSAKLHGSIDYLGIPDPTEHGFCYGTMPEPSHDNGADCTELGATSAQASFEDDVDSLLAGTEYYVRAYATNNAGTAYGNEQSFWTKTEAPTGVTTTAHVNAIEVEWSAALGADKFKIYRQGPHDVAPEFVDEIGAEHTTFTDYGVLGGLPNSPVLTIGAQSTEHVRIEWNDPGVADGDTYEYTVVAVNVDGLESDASTPDHDAQNAPLGSPIGFYEVEIDGSGIWTRIDDELFYEDEEAPLGVLTAGAITVSRGAYLDKVTLSSLAASSTDGAARSYRVRAARGGEKVDAEYSEPSNSESGYRVVENITYLWERTATDDSNDEYFSLDFLCAPSLNCEDDSLPVSGESRHYRVKISADGADSIYSSVAEGAFAKLHLAFATEPDAEIVAGEEFTIAVRTINQFDDHFSIESVPVSVAINQHAVVSGSTTESTDENGLAIFENLRITKADVGYEFSTTSADDLLNGELATSEEFVVVAADADEEKSAISGESGVLADGVAQAQIDILLRDEFENPVINKTPTFEALGGGTTPGACSATNASGQSTCTLTSVYQGEKTLKLLSPVEKIDGTLKFEFICINSPFYWGDGNDSPYEICNPEHLNNVASIGTSAHFLLIDNIDMSGVDYNMITTFSGFFEGNGHVISNLSVIEPGVEYVGFIGQFNGGEVRDLGLADVTVVGSSYTGGIAGKVQFGTVAGVYVTGSISGTTYAGGIAGWSNDSSIEDAYVVGDVIAEDYAGGIAGRNTHGVVKRVYSSVNLTSDAHANNLIGFGDNSFDVDAYYNSEASCNAMVCDYSNGIGRTIAQMNDPIDYDTHFSGLGFGEESAWKHVGYGMPRLKWEDVPYCDSAEEDFTLHDGEGTVEDPYLLCNASHLNFIAAKPEFMDAHLKLVHPLDMNDLEATPYQPIGSEVEPFTGVLDGSRLTIANLTINSPTTDYVGLIGYADGAVIKELRLVDAAVTGQDYTGGFVGKGDQITIHDSSISGEVNGRNHTGGLLGGGSGKQIWQQSDILRSHSTALVSGEENTGGLIGSIQSGYLDLIYATGAVSGSSRVGGLIGSAQGGYLGYFSMSQNPGFEIYATGEVTATGGYVGGLIGITTSVDVFNAYATGDVTSTSGDYVGGLIGSSDSNLGGAYTTGNVSAGGDYVGGVAGYNTRSMQGAIAIGDVSSSGSYVGGILGYGHYGFIQMGMAFGDVTGKNQVGGLVGAQHGVLESWGDRIGEIRASFARGNVSGESEVGGLVGSNAGFVKDAYATGEVTGTASSVGGLIGLHLDDAALIAGYAAGGVSGVSDVGRLVGKNGEDSPGEIGSAYYNFDASCVSAGECSSYGTPLVAPQLSNRATNFQGFEFGQGHNGNWTWVENSGSPPRLYYEPMIAEAFLPLADYTIPTCDSDNDDFTEGPGDGSANSPFLICSPNQLNNIGTAYLDKHFKLVADIDMSGVSNFNKIGSGSSRFVGVFDGGGHIVSNLVMNTSGASVGLFGYIGEGGVVKNVGVENISISGNGFSVGGLVGENRGTISNTYVTGSVSAYSEVGGLVGNHYHHGAITNSYANVNVVATDRYAGGLIGDSSGTVTNSYAMGSVSADGSVGPAFGWVSSHTNVYYNSDASCEIASGSCNSHGTARTEAQFYDDENFRTNFAGFDFDFASDGAWKMRKYSGSTPRLSWEYVPACDPEDHFTSGLGSGTADDPYGICSASQLNSIGSSYRNTHFMLLDDLDMSSVANFNPIGNSSSKFNGSFDGRNFTLSNLKIDRSSTEYVGMFGYTDRSANIMDLSLVDVDVFARRYVGGLIGYALGGTVSNVYVSGQVRADWSVAGGLIGQAYDGSSVSNAHFDGEVTTVSDVGGLIGFMRVGSTVSQSSAVATVVQTGYGHAAGGLVGKMDNNSSVSTSFSMGSVSGYRTNGGLVGDLQNSTISNSYSHSNVTTSQNYVGGLVGGNWGGSITTSYATGNVSGGSDVGRLVGIISGSSASGTWTVGTMTASYYSSGSSCSSSCNSEGTGLSAEALKDPDSYSGWNFAGTWVMGDDSPVLSWE